MASDLASGPLFVVGVWRSGTSLLYALLNQHPQIALMYEGELPTLWPLFWIPGIRSRWLARWDFWNSALTRHQIDPARIPAKISGVRDASAAVYKEYAKRKGATVWGDKSPNYFDSLTRIAGTFPNARFIIIWRNPAGVCRSIIKAAKGDSYFAKGGMTHRALLGCQTMKAECDHLLRRGTPVYQIQYEEMIANPTQTMMEVCKFLGIPFDRRMTSLNGADRSAVYAGEHHTLVKSESIVPSSERLEILSPDFKSKIERYTLLWKEAYGGQWPAFPPVPNSESGKPTLVERLFDRTLYRSLRGFDLFVRVVYSLVPLSLLRAYRDSKGRNDETKPTEPTAATEREKI